jgi:hypothetical protein
MTDQEKKPPLEEMKLYANRLADLLRQAREERGDEFALIVAGTQLAHERMHPSSPFDIIEEIERLEVAARSIGEDGDPRVGTMQLNNSARRIFLPWTEFISDDDDDYQLSDTSKELLQQYKDKPTVGTMIEVVTQVLRDQDRLGVRSDPIAMALFAAYMVERRARQAGITLSQ